MQLLNSFTPEQQQKIRETRIPLTFDRVEMLINTCSVRSFDEAFKSWKRLMLAASLSETEEADIGIEFDTSATNTTNVLHYACHVNTFNVSQFKAFAHCLSRREARQAIYYAESVGHIRRVSKGVFRKSTPQEFKAIQSGNTCNADPVILPAITLRQERISHIVKQNPGIKIGEVANLMGIRQRYVSDALTFLIENQKVWVWMERRQRCLYPVGDYLPDSAVLKSIIKSPGISAPQISKEISLNNKSALADTHKLEEMGLITYSPRHGIRGWKYYPTEKAIALSKSCSRGVD